MSRFYAGGGALSQPSVALWRSMVDARGEVCAQRAKWGMIDT